MSANYTPLDISKFQQKTTTAAISTISENKSRIPDIAIIIAVIVFIGSIAFAVANTQFSSKSRASFDEPPVALPVKKSESSLTKLQKQILDNEAKRRNIFATTKNASAASKTKDASASALTESARYEKIKETIIMQDVQSVTAYTIGFWIPPDDSVDIANDTAKADLEKVKQSAKKAYTDISTRLQAGVSALYTAQAVAKKYPELADKVALNGILIKDITEDYVPPMIIEYGKADMTQPLYKAMFSMKKGDVKTIQDDPTLGNGGQVVYIVNTTDSEIKTFTEWLRKKEDQYQTNTINTITSTSSSTLKK